MGIIVVIIIGILAYLAIGKYFSKVGIRKAEMRSQSVWVRNRCGNILKVLSQELGLPITSSKDNEGITLGSKGKNHLILGKTCENGVPALVIRYCYKEGGGFKEDLKTFNIWDEPAYVLRNVKEMLEVHITSIEKTWTLMFFAREFGPRMQVGEFVNKETQEQFKACIFTNQEGKRTYVAFSTALGELTPAEISSRKEHLQIVKLSNGNYVLCSMGWQDVDLF